MSDYQDILVEETDQGVILIRLNRPESYNALRTALLSELSQALCTAESDTDVRCAVLYGNEKVFAAGADIKEMAAMDTVDFMQDKRVEYWTGIRRFSKPLLAAVNGYALGGGCELALHADIVVAGSNASFGQPEINLGIMPGAGGTQRLIRTVGKSMAMKMVLSGESIDAQTALDFGLIARITQPELTLETTLNLAKTIAGKSPIAVRLAKKSLLDAYETTLETGLNLERNAFTLLSATEDRREGMQAFIEKRRPEFKGR